MKEKKINKGKKNVFLVLSIFFKFFLQFFFQNRKNCSVNQRLKSDTQKNQTIQYFTVKIALYGLKYDYFAILCTDLTTMSDKNNKK